ncbi:MAG: ATP synthase F1 subunit gamma [Candidatus Zixiibacteriota bacterium]
MATTRDLKKRIRAVESTKQITKAMEMVAAAKLRRAQQRIESYRPYAEKMVEMLGHLSSASGQVTHPFFEKREVKKTTLVLFTSDRGLCGSYNSNLIRTAEAFRKDYAPENLDLVCVGKRGRDYFRRRNVSIAASYLDFSGNMDLAKVRDMTYFLTNSFVSGEVDQIVFLYTAFISTARFRIARKQFLPIEQEFGVGEEAHLGKEYIFEPDAASIYAALLPNYVQTVAQMSMAEALASEHGTRMIAMGSATKNAGEMIDNLTLVMNKARQATITKELLEVVSGAEALKG